MKNKPVEIKHYPEGLAPIQLSTPRGIIKYWTKKNRRRRLIPGLKPIGQVVPKHLAGRHDQEKHGRTPNTYVNDIIDGLASLGYTIEIKEHRTAATQIPGAPLVPDYEWQSVQVKSNDLECELIPNYQNYSNDLRIFNLTTQDEGAFRNFISQVGILAKHNDFEALDLQQNDVPLDVAAKLGFLMRIGEYDQELEEQGTDSKGIKAKLIRAQTWLNQKYGLRMDERYTALAQQWTRQGKRLDHLPGRENGFLIEARDVFETMHPLYPNVPLFQEYIVNGTWPNDYYANSDGSLQPVMGDYVVNL